VDGCLMGLSRESKSSHWCTIKRKRFISMKWSLWRQPQRVMGISGVAGTLPWMVMQRPQVASD